MPSCKARGRAVPGKEGVPAGDPGSMGDGWWLPGWRRQEVHRFWRQEGLCSTCRAAASDKVWSPANFFRQLERLTGTALGLTDGSNHPSVGWKGPGISNAGDLWKVLKINFLMQLIDELTRRDALLDMLPTDKTDQMEDAKVKGSHGCGHHETVELKIWRAVSKINSPRIQKSRRPAWEGPMGNSPGGQRGPGELGDPQEQFLQSTRMVQSNVQNQTQQRASRDEQGNPG